MILVLGKRSSERLFFTVVVSDLKPNWPKVHVLTPTDSLAYPPSLPLSDPAKSWDSTLSHSLRSIRCLRSVFPMHLFRGTEDPVWTPALTTPLLGPLEQSGIAPWDTLFCSGLFSGPGAWIRCQTKESVLSLGLVSRTLMHVQETWLQRLSQVTEMLHGSPSQAPPSHVRSWAEGSLSWLHVVIPWPGSH